MADSYSIHAILSAKDRSFSSVFGKAVSKANMFEKTLSGGLGFGILTGIGQQAFNVLSNGLKMLGGSVVKSGAEFDSAMSKVAATMADKSEEMIQYNGKTIKAMDALREYAQEMGRTTKFTASEAGEALNYMALAGYDATTSISMLPNVLNLAAAGGMDLAKASDMVTDTQTAFGISLERTTQMVDEMAKAASTGNTNVEQLGEAFLVVGGLAKELNGGVVKLADGTEQSVDGIQELEIALTSMANAGIKGSEAGTHMRNMLLKLSSPTAEGTKALEAMGVSVFDTEGKMRSLKDIFGDLNKEMGKMSQENKIKTISELFNTRDMASASALLSAISTDWDNIGASILDAEGAAQKMANTMLDNFEGDVTKMKSAWEGFSITLWDRAKESGRGVVQTFTDMISKATAAVENSDFIESVAGTIQKGLQWLMTNIPKAIQTIKPYWEVFRDAVKEVGAAFMEAFGEIGKSLGELKGGQSTLSSFKTVVEAVKNVLIKVANFLRDHADTIAKLISMLPKLVMAFLAVKAAMAALTTISSIATLFGSFGGAVGGAGSKMKQFGQTVFMVGAGILMIAASFLILVQVANQLIAAGGPTIALFFGLTGAIAGLLVIMGVFGPSIKEAGQGVALLGVGVMLLAASFMLLVQAAIQLTNAGGPTIAVFFGMLGAIAGLMVIMGLFGYVMKDAGIAMVLLGAGVLMVAAGFALMTQSAIALTSAGGAAIAVFFGMIGALAALMVLVSVLGPGLLVGGAGALLLGAGLALAGAGALMLAAALAIVVASLPKLVTYGASGAKALAQLAVAGTALGASLFVLGAGALTAAAGIVAFGGAMLVAVAGTAAMAIALAAVTAEMLIISASAAQAESSLNSMKSSVSVVEDGLKQIGNIAKGAMNALIGAFDSSAAKVQASGAKLVASFMQVTNGAMQFASSFQQIAMIMTMLAAAFGQAGASATQLANAVMSMGIGFGMIATGARASVASINSIAANAGKVGPRLTVMASGARQAGTSLAQSFNGAAQNASSSLNKMVQAINNAEGKVKTAANQIGNGFRTAIQSSFSAVIAITNRAMASFASAISAGAGRAISTARSMSSQIAAAMNSGISGAYNAGAQIGNGLARGLASQVSNVARQAAALAAQANAAIAAKAKIGSPSKVTTQFGKWYGEGFGNGIKDMFGYVWGVSEDLVMIPALADVPSARSTRSLNDNYRYGNNTTYVIDVPLEIEGRPFAKATAVYTQDEINSINSRNLRKQGIR